MNRDQLWNYLNTINDDLPVYINVEGDLYDIGEASIEDDQWVPDKSVIVLWLT